MNKLHRLAIELKYKGSTYEEISKLLGGKFSPGTLKMYFANEGMLNFPYLEYEDSQNRMREGEGRNILKKEVIVAVKVIVNAMYKAVRDNDLDRAVKFAEIILDRAGLTTPKASVEVRPLHTTIITDAELDEILRKEGLDPRTGLPIKKFQAQA